MTEIIAYCLGEAASRFGIELIAWLAMSNHYHAVVRDPRGELPAFVEHFHKMVARALNTRWDRVENLWSSKQTSMVYLPTPADVFDKVVYVLCNPLADHLVDRLTNWPGCSSLRNLGGKTTTHARPKVFFRPHGGMPEAVTLTARCPDAARGSESVEEWTSRVRAAVDARERALRELRLREGIRIVGRQRVLRAAITDTPATEEPRGTLDPCVACKDPVRRIAELLALKQFRLAHQRAREKFVRGDREVEFPPGTYRMRRWGARCAELPALAA